MNNDQLTIGNDQLPEGYQQTEVGVIPEDWNIRELGNLGKFKNGINKGSEDFGHGSPFVNLMDVFGISSISEAEHLGLVNSNDAEKKVYDLREGDVLFIRSSVKPSGVGLTTVVTRDLPNTVYSGFLIRFRDSENLETDFKKYCFSEEKFRQRVVANSTVSANTNINQDNLKKLNLAYPESAAEQRSISQALSDVDALIAGLNKAIDKKRAIKTATMQQLLTGKKRLPGFGSEWTVKRLGDYCELITKGTTPTSIGRSFTVSGVNFFKAESISESGEPILDKVAFIDQITHKLLERSQLKAGDLLISIAGVLGRVGRVSQDVLPANTNQALAIVRLGTLSALQQEFIFYYLRSSMTLKQIKDVNVQGAQANISLQNVQDLEIYVPPTVSEQCAIATVLSDMDAAIAALEIRLAKTQALKQGMMQALLTGRVRLV